MEYCVTCIVADDGVMVSCCIIYQGVAFGYGVGNLFLLLCGDLVEGWEHGGVN